MNLILAQIFRIIGSVFSISSDKSTNIKKIFLFNGISNVFCSISYFCMNAITGAISSILALFRNIMFYKYKEKVTIGALILYFIIIILFNLNSITGFISFIPILLVIIYTSALYTKKPLTIKYSIITVCLLEIIYDYVYSIYVGIIVCVLDMILVSYSICKMSKKGEI